MVLCFPFIQINCLSREEASGVPDLLGILEKVIVPSLLHQAKLYQCGESTRHYLETTSIAEEIMKKDSSFTVSSCFSHFVKIGCCY